MSVAVAVLMLNSVFFFGALAYADRVFFAGERRSKREVAAKARAAKALADYRAARRIEFFKIIEEVKRELNIC